MRKLTIKKQEYLPNLSEIESFEIEKGIRLPDDIRAFFLTQNPSDIEESNYPVRGEDPYYINALYSFNPSGKFSLQSVYNKLNEFFKGKYLAFGCDSGGWQYVISVQESDYGKVYFCRMDEALEDALTLLADSFEKFIDNLEVEIEE